MVVLPLNSLEAPKYSYSNILATFEDHVLGKGTFYIYLDCLGWSNSTDPTKNFSIPFSKLSSLGISKISESSSDRCLILFTEEKFELQDSMRTDNGIMEIENNVEDDEHDSIIDEPESSVLKLTPDDQSLVDVINERIKEHLIEHPMSSSDDEFFDGEDDDDGDEEDHIEEVRNGLNGISNLNLNMNGDHHPPPEAFEDAD